MRLYTYVTRQTRPGPVSRFHSVSRQIISRENLSLIKALPCSSCRHCSFAPREVYRRARVTAIFNATTDSAFLDVIIATESSTATRRLRRTVRLQATKKNGPSALLPNTNVQTDDAFGQSKFATDATTVRTFPTRRRCPSNCRMQIGVRETSCRW